MSFPKPGEKPKLRFGWYKGDPENPREHKQEVNEASRQRIDEQRLQRIEERQAAIFRQQRMAMYQQQQAAQQAPQPVPVPIPVRVPVRTPQPPVRQRPSGFELTARMFSPARKPAKR